MSAGPDSLMSTILSGGAMLNESPSNPVHQNILYSVSIILLVSPFLYSDTPYTPLRSRDLSRTCPSIFHKTFF